MIDFDAVTDEIQSNGQPVTLFADAEFHMPPGRYALLSLTPELHRPVIDVLAGLRPPHQGHVSFSGSISWPIGRAALVRGKVSGLDAIAVVADLHDIERDYAEELVALLISRPDYLDQPFPVWPAYVKQEFIYALGLVPEFDIYVIDAPIPFEESRFTRLWQALFEERLVGKTLIFSTSRQKQMLDYCAKALIYHGQSLYIDNDLEGCIERFPARQAREDLGTINYAGGGDDAEFLF